MDIGTRLAYKTSEPMGPFSEQEMQHGNQESDQETEEGERSQESKESRDDG
jgi:hypothetical protein